jgi:hypothetical protein
VKKSLLRAPWFWAWLRDVVIAVALVTGAVYMWLGSAPDPIEDQRAAERVRASQQTQAEALLFSKTLMDAALDAQIQRLTNNAGH